MAEHQYDVIVVGAGNAALVAALTAHEEGAKVLVLEAAPKKERGGNSRFSGGIFRFVHDGPDTIGPLLGEDGRYWLGKVDIAAYTAERFYEDVQSTSGGRADVDLVKQMVEQSQSTVEWMRDQGVQWEISADKLFDPDKLDPNKTYTMPEGGCVRAIHEGVGLIQNLFDAVDAAGIDVWYSSPGHELLQEGSKVIGIRVAAEDRFVDVHGAVVLAAGGFESNPEMRLCYLGEGWDLVKVRGTRYNMGTMITEALSSGAQPAGHWGGCHASPLDSEAPPVGELSLTDKMSRYSYPYSLLVNIHGERFVDEGEDEVWLTYAKTGGAIREQPQALAYQLFDQKNLHLLEPRYSTGTPIEANSLADLAGKLGLPADALERTVETFNAAAPDGEFNPLRKDGLRAAPQGQPVKSNWAVPLDSPPYVAYGVTCGITFTYGGLKINTDAQVIDTANRPMAGLYATGELTGDFFYHNYPAGTGLMRGAVYGRIAGTSAARHAKG